MTDLLSRVGTFTIDRRLIEEDPANGIAALDGCVVFAAVEMDERRFDGVQTSTLAALMAAVLQPERKAASVPVISYIAAHPSFDPVEGGYCVGKKPPRYHAVIRGGRRTFERMETGAA